MYSNVLSKSDSASCYLMLIGFRISVLELKPRFLVEEFDLSLQKCKCAQENVSSIISFGDVQTDGKFIRLCLQYDCFRKETSVLLPYFF